MVEFANVPAKHWILIVVSAAGLWKLPARAVLPLFGVAALILSEALGLMPSSFAMLKYLIVLLLVGVYAGGEHGWAIPAPLKRRFSRVASR
jgi:hypothetical protein